MPTSSKQLLQRYDNLRQQVQQATVAPSDEPKAKQQERIARARKDYAFFVRYYFPHYATAECAKFHVRAASLLKKDQQFRGIMEWARGLAKSTHFNVLIPLWLKMQEEEQIKLMVSVGKSEDAAIRQLSDLQAELEGNNRYIHDFGQQLAIGSWEEGEFTTRDGACFVALGRGQSPRGLRNRAQRPDYIVCDDLDDDQIVLNESRVDRVINWIKTALIGSMDIGRARFILVNNRISKGSILAKMATENQETKKLKHIRVNALDKGGNPSWPEKYTKAYYDDLREFQGSIAFETEYMNNPIEAGRIFQRDWIQWKNAYPLHQYQALLAYCDPGFKNTKTADHKALVLMGIPKTRQGQEFHIIDCRLDKASLGTMIDWHFEFYNKYREFGIRFKVEDVFLQDLLFKEFNEEGRRRGQFLPVSGDKRKKPNKQTRIMAMTPFFERGVLFFNGKEKHNHHMQRLRDHFLAFDPGARTPDDGPDAVEGGLYELNSLAVNQELKPSMGARKKSKRW